jgi:MoaA/NifB/PqqE/SkfB family radical SAM enzyme
MLMLTLLTDNKCNVACPYCFVKTWSRKESVLNVSEYKSAIRQAKQLGAKSLWWVGAGEPFLYPHWRDLVEYATEQDMWIGIFSNGTLLDDELARVLFSNQVSLYVKMNSFNREIQDAMMGGAKGSFEKIQSCLEHLIKIGFNKERRLAIETVVTRLNLCEIPSIFRWAREREIIPLIEMMEHANDDAAALDVTLLQHRTLFEKLRQIDKREYGYSWVPTVPWAGIRCRNLYLGLAIDADGTVRPCSGLQVTMGNIKERPLEYWWESEVARLLRDPDVLEHRASRHIRLGSYGCKSHAFHMTGNPLSLDPRLKAFH